MSRRGVGRRRAVQKDRISLIEPSRSAPTYSLSGLDPDLEEFYRNALTLLNGRKLPYLVGGAYALHCHAGITRHTHDLDLLVRREDYERIAAAFEEAGHRTDLVFPHWLGKAFRGGDYIDLIFGSGNGEMPVDDSWFEHATVGELFGVEVELCPVEEMIWSKSFILERERCDAADVAHLLRATAERLDWARLLRRFGGHYRVLLAQLVLFGFVYPGERQKIPEAVMRRLAAKLAREIAEGDAKERVCQGTLLSREQYLVDVEQWGYEDARLEPRGAMSREDIRHWTAAIAPKK